MMITVSNLRYSYQGTSSISFPDFSVKENEQVLLLGESGSDKTTLLHLLGGLLRTYKGSIKVGDSQLSDMSERALDKFRGQKIGFVFQRNHLISALTVEQNLKMSFYLSDMPISQDRVDAVLEEVDLLPKKHSRITELSHGQAQRVAIARAVLNRPSIILADEPTSALDDRNCERVVNLLSSTAKSNRATLVIATHDHRLRNVIDKQISLV